MTCVANPTAFEVRGIAAGGMTSKASTDSTAYSFYPHLALENPTPPEVELATNLPTPLFVPALSRVALQCKKRQSPQCFKDPIETSTANPPAPEVPRALRRLV